MDTIGSEVVDVNGDTVAFDVIRGSVVGNDVEEGPTEGNDCDGLVDGISEGDVVGDTLEISVGAGVGDNVVEVEVVLWLPQRGKSGGSVGRTFEVQ